MACCPSCGAACAATAASCAACGAIIAATAASRDGRGAATLSPAARRTVLLVMAGLFVLAGAAVVLASALSR